MKQLLVKLILNLKMLLKAVEPGGFFNRNTLFQTMIDERFMT